MHALPTALVADFLTDRRFDVIDLGANTPTKSFVDVAMAADGLVGLGVSVAVDECVDGALAQTIDLRAALGDTLIVVGGSAIVRSGRGEEFSEHADVVTSSFTDVVAAFEQAVTDDDDDSA